jgi:hypothetical protein
MRDTIPRSRLHFQCSIRPSAELRCPSNIQQTNDPATNDPARNLTASDDEDCPDADEPTDTTVASAPFPLALLQNPTRTASAESRTRVLSSKRGIPRPLQNDRCARALPLPPSLARIPFPRSSLRLVKYYLRSIFISCQLPRYAPKPHAPRLMRGPPPSPSASVPPPAPPRAAAARWRTRRWRRRCAP